MNHFGELGVERTPAYDDTMDMMTLFLLKNFGAVKCITCMAGCCADQKMQIGFNDGILSFICFLSL